MTQPIHTPGACSINPRKGRYQALPANEQERIALESIGAANFEALSIGTTKGQIAIIPLDESSEANARLLAAAYNAFDSAARVLNCNAVELAERMADGGIAELVSAIGELVGYLDLEYGEQEVDRNCPTARAVLAKVKGGAT